MRLQTLQRRCYEESEMLFVFQSQIRLLMLFMFQSQIRLLMLQRRCDQSQMSLQRQCDQSQMRLLMLQRRCDQSQMRLLTLWRLSSDILTKEWTNAVCVDVAPLVAFDASHVAHLDTKRLIPDCFISFGVADRK